MNINNKSTSRAQTLSSRVAGDALRLLLFDVENSAQNGFGCTSCRVSCHVSIHDSVVNVSEIETWRPKQVESSPIAVPEACLPEFGRFFSHFGRNHRIISMITSTQQNFDRLAPFSLVDNRKLLFRRENSSFKREFSNVCHLLLRNYRKH